MWGGPRCLQNPGRRLALGFFLHCEKCRCTSLSGTGMGLPGTPCSDTLRISESRAVPPDFSRSQGCVCLNTDHQLVLPGQHPVPGLWDLMPRQESWHSLEGKWQM